MPFFTTALALGGLAAAGSLGGAAIASSGAKGAAQTQSDAALQAAELQHQDAQQALGFQEQQWNTQQQNLQPWLTAGKGALGNLQGLLKDPGFNTPPTAATEQNDPGYEFRLKQGMDAMQNSASAKGGLLSGNTAKALEDYSQNYASNEYNNVYNRWHQQESDKFNRYADIAGVGQTAATTLGQEGQGASNNIAQLLLGAGQQQGNSIQNAAAARASGDVASSNAYGGALGGIGSNLTSLLMMNQLLGQQQQPAPQFYGA